MNTARAYVGTPYRHQGRSRNGMDCVGLVVRVVQSLGLSSFDVDGYARNPSGQMMRRLLSENASPIDLAAAQPGDVLHIAFGKQPQHLAIVSHAAPIRIIHADSIAGAVVEHGLDNDWRSKVRGAYRVLN